MDLQSFLFSIVLFAMVLGSCIALFKYKNLPSVLKNATWYILAELIAQTAVFTVLWYQKRNEYLLFHISFILEAITLLLMYREIFKKYIEEKEKYIYRKIFIVLIALFIVFAIVNTICWQPLTIYPSNTRVVLSAMIIILNILYIYQYTSHEPIPRTGLELVNYQMTRVSLFWIITGLLLFHSFSLVRYMFINILKEELTKESYKDIANIYNVFIIILYIFIAIGFIKAKHIIIVDDRKIDTKNI